MLKILSIIASFFVGKLRSGKVISLRIEDFIDYAVNRLKNVLGAAAFGLSGIVLAFSGFLFSYFNLLNQYDQRATVTMSAVAIGGIVLCLFGLLFLYISYVMVRRPVLRPTTVQAQAHAQAKSSLEDALAALVLDFVKARQAKRGEPGASFAGAASGESRDQQSSFFGDDMTDKFTSQQTH